MTRSLTFVLAHSRCSGPCLLLLAIAIGGGAPLDQALTPSSSLPPRPQPKLLPPFGQPGAPRPANTRNIVRTRGVRVWDDRDREYIDGIGSLWYCQVGYGRREIIDAVSRQLETAMYNNFPPCTSDIAEEAAARIVGLSPAPNGRAYLCTSGGEAIDTAFKIARTVAQIKGQPARQIIVRRSRAYHGVNLGGTSAMGLAANREGWGDLLPHMLEVEADSLADAERAFADHGERIAAVVCEPVQAAGGVHPPVDAAYLPGLRDLCTRHGALLILDEVVTGFGRTGRWFASQTYGVAPDLLTFAKGATSGYQPLGGVVASRAVCDVLEADPAYVFRHGHTFSGHAAACAACLANIDIIESEGLVARADSVGERLSAGLRALADRGDVRGARGVGALWAAQLHGGDDPGTAAAVRDAMLDLGVIARPLGDSIAFCPPLVMEDEDVDAMVGALAQAVRKVG